MHSKTLSISPRIKIREALATALGQYPVYHYRLIPFNATDLPAINILPDTSPEPMMDLRVDFKDTESFRVEAAIARKNDVIDFAAEVDNLYEEVRIAIVKLKPDLRCPKVKIVNRTFAVSEVGAVPFVLIRFTVKVEYEIEDD